MWVSSKPDRTPSKNGEQANGKTQGRIALWCLQIHRYCSASLAYSHQQPGNGPLQRYQAIKSCGTPHLDVFDHARIHCTLESIIRLLVSTRAFASILCRSHLLLHSLVHCRQKDDLAVGCLGHGLHRLEIADLHRRCRRQDISGLKWRVSSCRVL